jgi:putative transposase
MSWVRVYIHMVFATKNREHLLNSRELREKIFQHIKINAKEKEIRLDSLNGSKEHVHCLISLGKEQTISKVAQLIKGESSFWINKNSIMSNQFNWQDDFWAVGVSESHIKYVRDYIFNQEEHHQKKSFNDEIKEFMEKYGWTLIHGS